MKFRAKIVDLACLNHFTRVSNMIAKLAKTCTLRISPEKLNFILSDKLASGGVSMWCELEQENIFSEFQMEGVSAENNEIYLELTSENLSRALKTAQNARALKIKLTNKHFPCLTVSVELLSSSSSSRIVTHDIPIKVIPRRLWKDLQEPSVPDSDVSIYLPALKTMKSVVEKMKNISNHLVIEANLNGDLNLKIETELVCVTTHFKDLGNPILPSESVSQNRHPEDMVEVHIDIRKLLQFLAGQQVTPTKAVCNIVFSMLISPNRHVWELSANHATPLSLAACLVSHQYSYNMWNLAQLTEGSSSLPSHCLKNLSAWGTCRASQPGGTCRISQPGEPAEPLSLGNLQGLSSQPGEPAEPHSLGNLQSLSSQLGNLQSLSSQLGNLQSLSSQLGNLPLESLRS